jgi:hypothetical protein
MQVLYVGRVGIIWPLLFWLQINLPILFLKQWFYGHLVDFLQTIEICGNKLKSGYFILENHWYES